MDLFNSFRHDVLCKTVHLWLVASTVLAFPLHSVAQLTFTQVAGSGADQSNIAGSKHGGCSFADYDLDGDLDLLVNTSTDDAVHRGFLLRNDNGVLTDVTATAAPQLKDFMGQRTAAWGDINNDGYPDFMVNHWIRIQIYLNNGAGGFTRIVNMTTIQDGMNTEGAGWLDYDNDGDLDLFVENDSFGIDLFDNDGSQPTPNFTHITSNAVGAPGTGAGGIGLPQGGSSDGDYATSVDVNNDGYVDIIARRRNNGTNDGLDNNPYDIFMNDGDGSFTPNTIFNERGNNSDKGAVLAGDFDNDGDFDILWTSGTTDAGRTVIYENTGNNSMNLVMVSNPFQVENGSPETAIDFDGAAMGDVDNDGDLDVFLTQDSGPSRLYLNNSTGAGVFAFRQAGPTWIPGAALNYGINVNGNGEGCVMVDFDNDGDLDVYLNRHGSTNQLWRNNFIGSAAEAAAPYQNNYLRVIAEVDLGGGVYRSAVNATLKFLDCDGNELGGIREVGSGGAGHGAQTNPWPSFGLPNGPEHSYLIEVQFTRNGTTPIIVQRAVRPSLLPVVNRGSSLLLEQTVVIRDTDANDTSACEEDCADGIDNDNDGLADCDDPDCHLNGTGYNWYFGQNAALNFENGSGPVQISPSSLNAEEGCAGWSSPSGDLLFYTNGVNAYDVDHNIMPNGNGLGGHTSGTQSGVIVQDPSNADRYYVFGNSNGGNQVRYSVIDMTLNGGLGDVVTGLKNLFLQNTQGEKLAAWPHANGSDYWLVTVDQNNMFAHQVTAAGLVAPVTTNIPSQGRVYGQMKFGPDGSQLAMACYPSSFSNYRIQVLDFDNSTGTFSNLREWALDEPYGVEFSPDGKLLYATDMGWGSSPGRLMQYEIDGNATGADILSTETLLLSAGYLHSALQAGPDGKIYMATSLVGNNPRNGLAVINLPNVIGAGANAVADQITFTGGAMSRSGLPNYPYYQINGEPTIGFVSASDTCLGIAQLRAFATGATGYQWLLNGNAIGGANSNTYTPTGIGYYQVVATFTCGSDTSDVITFYADNDGDCLADMYDLDDDNDGIPDTEEQTCAGNTIGDFNAPVWDYGTGFGADASSIGIIAGVPYTITFTLNGGTKLFTSTNKYTSNSSLGHGGNPGSLLLGGNDESLTFNFTSPVDVVLGFDHLGPNPPTDDGWIFNTPANEIVSLNASHQIIGGMHNIAGVEFRPGGPGTNNISSFKWKSTTSITVTGRGLSNTTLGLNFMTVSCDTDGDGIADQFDLDSDNDGIYDVVEAGSGQPHTNGVLNGAITENGIPISVDANADDVVDYTIADSDSDGRIDAVELDSDNDGCTDVLEAGFTDNDQDGELGNAVTTEDANGVVTSGTDGYTGTTAFVTDPALQAGCPDKDGDQISNTNDLDDDNDGILDVSEYDLTASWLAFNATWSQSSAPFTGGFINNTTVVASMAPLVIGSGSSATITGQRLEMPTIASNTLAEAITNSEYVEYTFTTQPNINAALLGEFSQNKHPASAGATAASYGYHVGLAISDDGFATYRMVQDDYYEDTNLPGGYDHSFMLEGNDPNVQLAPSTTYIVRVYFFGKEQAGLARFDDFAVLSYYAAYVLDQDADGVNNHCDLDSDNDGIYDCVEAGHYQPHTAGSVDGGVDPDGIPSIVSNGSSWVNYVYANSDNADHLDPYELDSDGDLCNDVIEAGFIDHNDDGELGDVPLTVDDDGVVTSGGP